MIEFLFLDLDDTILDFHRAERVALSKTLIHFGIDPTEHVLNRYHLINKSCWERLEKGELTRDQVLVERYRLLFLELGLACDPEAVTALYTEYLAIGHWFMPGAEEAVKRLSGKYRLFLASNGTASVQAGRMTSANLYRFFEKAFVSQEIGYNKPSLEYFQRCFAQIPDFDPEKAMMVGDSLTSDIQGGINAGIKTCWVNPDHKTGHIQPDYEIESLSQLYDLLETL